MLKIIFRSLLCIVAIFSLCFNMVGCDFKPKRSPYVLVNRLGDNPATLNPILATDAESSSVLEYVYETLLKTDYKTLELQPMLAEKWDVSDDHLTYIFTIRKGVTWQDGVPFTVDDVIYSFERIQDPKVDAGRLRSYLVDVLSVKKINDDQVEFKYKKPYFKALEIIGAGMPIIPKHIFDNGEDFNTHSADRKPIGTGPFKFKEWETGQKVELERYDGYWGKHPEISGIVFKVIPNSTVALQLLKKGDLDINGLRAIQWAKQTESKVFNDKFNKYHYWIPNFAYIGWNLKKPYFKDRKTRIAMTMLLNRQEILDKLLFNQGEVVTGCFYKFSNAYNHDLAPYAYDPEEAKKLLKEAGWADTNKDGILDRNGIPFIFTYIYPTGSTFSRSLGLILRQNLYKIGIEVKLMPMEWAAMLGRMRDRDFDAVSLAWSLGFNQDPYQVWHSTQIKEGSNYIGFENKEVDKLLEQARVQFDPKKRDEIYRKVHEIIHYEEPYTFLFTTPNMIAVSKRFTNVQQYKAGLDILEWGVTPVHNLIQW